MGAKLSRTIIAKGTAVYKRPIIVKIYSKEFVVTDVKRTMKRGVAHTIRHTARRKLPVILFAYSKNTHVRRKVVSLVRVTGASTTLGHRDSTNFLCVPMLASPAAKNIATDFTVLKSVVLTRPKTLVKFTNPHIVRRAVKRGLPRKFRETRFLLRRKFISQVMAESRVGRMLKRVLGVRAIVSRGGRSYPRGGGRGEGGVSTMGRGIST